jgi:predicted permease
MTYTSAHRVQDYVRMSTLLQDVRLALRTLGRSPGFAIIAVLSLALGIGANTAIFGILDQVLLRSLPVHDPARLVLLQNPSPRFGRTENQSTFSYPLYKDLRDGNQVLEGLIAYYRLGVSFSHGTRTERSLGELVSGNYFEVLGVSTALGRPIGPEDDRTRGGHPVVVLSHGFWERRFGADPAILSQTVRVNGHPMTVIGIARRGFKGMEPGTHTDVFVPLTMKAQMTPTWDHLDNRHSHFLNLVGRLNKGVTIEQAHTGLNTLLKPILEMEIQTTPARSETFRKRFVSKQISVLPGGRGISDIRQQIGTPLVVLMCMVGVVLLIACANVANLMLARGAARQKEIAIRLSMGASRAQLVRQLLAESVVLAVAGGAAGLLIAQWTGSMLLSFAPEEAALGIASDPDGRVLGFAFGLSVLTGILFGLAPALQSTRPDVAGVLKDQALNVSAGVSHVRLRKALVVAQVALSLLLLATAGLFARSLYNLKDVNPGYVTERLLTFSLNPRLNGYSVERLMNFADALQGRLQAVPGVTGVSMSTMRPLSGSQWMNTVRVPGYEPKEGEDMNPSFDHVGGGYFATMKIPLLAGREFASGDTESAPRVAIINETMAKYFFGKQNPLGRKFGFGPRGTPDVEIVGVVRDIRHRSIRGEVPRFVFLPLRQTPEATEITYFVRTAVDAGAIANSVRREVANLDAHLPVYDMRTMEQQLDASLGGERAVAALSSAFGLLATLLAAIGLYGVMAYTVARRTREIGIRIALGAARRSVLGIVLREVGWMTAIGVAIGIPAAIASGRLVHSVLFGVAAVEPPILAGAVVLIAAIALLAGYFPARRATRVDPITALRYE